MTDILTIIVAAGSGSRFGASLPKQFCLMNERPVLMHTIDAVRNALPTAAAPILLVLNKDFVAYWHELCRTQSFVSPEIAEGGYTRWQSVKNALNHSTTQHFIQSNPNGLIMIHDGVRPFINSQMIEDAKSILSSDLNIHGAIAATPVTDSLRMRPDDSNTRAVDRSKYYAVQTPQLFRGQDLLDAYSAPYQKTFTDDASVIEAKWPQSIAISTGSPYNIKITNPLDIEIAKVISSLK